MGGAGTLTRCRKAALTLQATVVALGCMTRAKVLDVEPIRSTQPIPEGDLLDVGIVVFDTGLDPEGEPPDRVYPRIRAAEAVYLAAALRDTLQQTEQWGVVRLLPDVSDNVDVLLRGEILRSDGERLELKAEAHDASGRRWIKDTYETGTAETAFDAKAGEPPPEPYQSVFNQICNDLLEARLERTPEELRLARLTAEMRFAASLAPEAFGDYVVQDDGEYELQRLPAEDDPYFARVLEVRQRDAMFVDTLNQHYDAFQAQMADHYLEWRRISREETLAYMELVNKSRAEKTGGLLLLLASVAAVAADPSNAGVVMAGTAGATVALATFISAFETDGEAKMHHVALEELGESFDAEVAPMVVQVEGDTHRLQGSASTQYAEWSRLLRQLYEAETSPDGAFAVTVEIEPSEASAEGSDEPALPGHGGTAAEDPGPDA
jgi:hypothetical protein